MLLASLSKARQGLSSKSPLESVSVLFTLKVFLETIVGAAHPPETEVGRGERQAPLGGGLSLCNTPISHVGGHALSYPAAFDVAVRPARWP